MALHSRRGDSRLALSGPVYKRNMKVMHPGQREDTIQLQSVKAIAEIEDYSETGEESNVEQFLDRCTSCGTCTSECTLLRTFGTPDTIISRRNSDVFLCMNCGACTVVCPSGLDPADVLMQAKHGLLKTGQISDRVSKAVRAARRFEQWGRSFPFVHYSQTKTVFWPGCSLAGMSPGLVLETQKLLTGKLGEKVGISLDCCSNPTYQIGDLDTVSEACKSIKGKIEQQGITSIVSACANCVKILREYLPGVRVNHVLEVLPDIAAKSLAGKECYLHHPCPTSRLDVVQRRAERLLKGLGAMVLKQTIPRCCGYGGNVHALSTESADASTQEIMAAAGKAVIVTYCMSCKDRFLEKGGKAYHLLELLVPAAPVKRNLSSFRKWFNRFLLAQKSKQLDARK